MPNPEQVKKELEYKVYRRGELLRRAMNWLSGTDLIKEIRKELGDDA